VTSGISQTGTRRFAMAEDGVLRGDADLTAPPASEAAVLAMTPTGN